MKDSFPINSLEKDFRKMNFSSHPINRHLTGLMLALAASALPSMAATLTATPGTVTLTCSTTTGPSAAVNVVVKPFTLLTGSSTLAVTYGTVGASLVVTPPATATLSTANQAAGIIFTVKVKNGCQNAPAGASAPTFTLTASSVDLVVTANVTTTVGTASPLVTTPTSVSLTCMRTPGGSPTFTPGLAQKVQVKSTTPGGIPFTVGNSPAVPSWLTVSPMGGGTATSTSVDLSFVAAAGCGGFAVGSTNNFTVKLSNAPSPDKSIAVSLRVVPPTPLVAAPATAVISHTKGATVPGKADISITSVSVPGAFFSVSAASLPSWLTVDSMTGSVPRTLRFSVTAVAETMAPGTYSASVRLQVSNYDDMVLPVSLSLNNKAPRLSVSEGISRNITWTIGTPLPTPYVTAVSSDSPIPYTVDTSGPLKPIVAAVNLKDIAYSFGTPIPVTFDPNVFAAAAPGTVLEGTVNLTWGSPSATITVNFTVMVQAPGATLSGISPASLPTAPAGTTFTLVLTGTSFIPSSDTNIRTRVGIVNGSTFTIDPNISVNVVNSSSIILTIVAPVVASTNLPFSPSGSGGTVILGVCNPTGGVCTTPTGSLSFIIGSNPLIQSVASSSSFVQVTAPTIQTIAPYDLISIFGANFCSSGGTGCSSSDVIKGAPDPLTGGYPTFVSPDAAGATQRKLQVTFQTRAVPPVVIASAPILFTTNNQINIVTPAALAAQSGNSVDMVVSFGYGTGANLLSSQPFQVNVEDTNPGLFTVGSDGQGDGAILNPNLSPVAPGSEAGMRSTAADSDVVQFFVTGLGAPTSTGDNAAAGSAFTWSTDCVSISTYLDSVNNYATTSLTSIDGLIINSALLNTNRLVPCFASGGARVPTVTIGGVAGTVTYAGWVPDQVAGLYQINVKLPGSAAGGFTTSAGASLSAISTPVQLPVVVTSTSRSSQARVNVWVTRKLKVVGPSGSALVGTVGVAWPSATVVATEGTAPYRYTVTSGLLPSGLSLNPTTGAITGTPAVNTAGSYLVTVTATDNANFPISDKVSFTLTVAGGLVLTSTAVTAETFSIADATVTTVTASGGVYPYTYEITGPSPVPVGVAVDPNSGVLSSSTYTPAGVYHMAITATDSTADTPLTGAINFDLVVALKVSNTTPVNGANGTASTITTMSATGNTGTVTYALDTTSAALAWLAINASTGVVTITNAAPASTSRTVTVTATDSTTAPGAATAATGTKSFTLTIN